MPINTISKKPLLILFAVFLPLYLTWTFDHGLWNPDETRDAGIAREMYVHKEFAVPHLNGEAFLEKPPLPPFHCPIFVSHETFCLEIVVNKIFTQCE
jgi:4-amino-4-deoxy-L-arabinose transferase-like glycosyltransferase